MMKISINAAEKTKDFLENEREFRLGYLPTEQSHPGTAKFSAAIQKDTRRGVKLLLSVDKDIAAAAPAVLSSPRFKKLVAALREALVRGKRICFSGCGATGRLSILLESCWRKGIRELGARHPALKLHCDALENQVCSIMTGGDYALIRSVEFFEDYVEFGRRQVREAGLGKNDVLVAVSEGGETSSVIGTIHQALECGARAFFVFNNPARRLAARLERSRKVIKNPKVTVLELVSGPMAITGSTRMQATTFELLVLGTALEIALVEALRVMLAPQQMRATGLATHAPGAYGKAFANLLEDLSSPENLNAIAEMVELEERIYRQKGLVTYFGDEYLLDIFTDTTERSPTFMLPPFRKHADPRAPEPWALVKNPFFSTRKTWAEIPDLLT